MEDGPPLGPRETLRGVPLSELPGVPLGPRGVVVIEVGNNGGERTTLFKFKPLGNKPRALLATNLGDRVTPLAGPPLAGPPLAGTPLILTGKSLGDERTDAKELFMDGNGFGVNDRIVSFSSLCLEPSSISSIETDLFIVVFSVLLKDVFTDAAVLEGVTIFCTFFCMFLIISFVLAIAAPSLFFMR